MLQSGQKTGQWPGVTFQSVGADGGAKSLVIRQVAVGVDQTAAHQTTLLGL